MAGTYKQWQARVWGATTGLSEVQQNAVAQICLDTELAGDSVGVWHAAAMVLGKLNVCQCYPCCKARAPGRAA